MPGLNWLRIDSSPDASIKSVVQYHIIPMLHKTDKYAVLLIDLTTEMLSLWLGWVRQGMLT
jgi:hypothetical protein